MLNRDEFFKDYECLLGKKAQAEAEYAQIRDKIAQAQKELSGLDKAKEVFSQFQINHEQALAEISAAKHKAMIEIRKSSENTSRINQEEDTRLNEKRADIDQREKSLIIKEKSHAEKEVELTLKQDELIRKEKEIQELAESNQFRELKIKENLDCLENSVSRNDKELKTIADSLKNIEQEKQSNQEMVKVIRDENALLQRRKEEIKQLEQDNSEKTRFLNKKEQMLNDRESELDKKTKDLSVEKESLTRYKKNLDDKDKNLRAEQDDLNFDRAQLNAEIEKSRKKGIIK